MADVVLTIGEDGKLVGLGEANQRRWAKFLARVKGMMPGDTVKASFSLPRSPAFHRRHFAILHALFDNQEAFTDLDAFRMWVQVGAGFCVLLPGPKGKPVAVPKSIAWDRLDDADFAAHHDAVIAFVRSPHFRAFLWPDAPDADRLAGVEAILEEFGA